MATTDYTKLSLNQLQDLFKKTSIDILTHKLTNSYCQILEIDPRNNDDYIENYCVCLDHPIVDVCYLDYFGNMKKNPPNCIRKYSIGYYKHYICSLDEDKWSIFVNRYCADHRKIVPVDYVKMTSELFVDLPKKDYVNITTDNSNELTDNNCIMPKIDPEPIDYTKLTLDQLRDLFKKDCIDILTHKLANSYCKILGIDPDNDDNIIIHNYCVSLEQPLVDIGYLDYFDDIDISPPNTIVKYSNDYHKHYICTIEKDKWNIFVDQYLDDVDYEEWKADTNRYNYFSRSELDEMFTNDRDVVDVTDGPNQKLFIEIFGFLPQAPRPRRAFVNKLEPYLHMYGRCGGYNAEDYKDEIINMTKLPGFIMEQDDDYDNTYKDFYFDLYPDRWEKFITEINRGN